MAYKYFPQTDADIQEMLAAAGLQSMDDLYQEVPEELKLTEEFDLPSAMSEIEVRRTFDELGKKNRALTCFAGAGVYDRYTPAVIPYIINRSEFQTSYTPYQAEISQGTLQYIFEYQTMMTQLTGLDVSNASMYDGTTALAEAMMMAVAAGRKKDRVLVASTLNPFYREVLDTYAHYHGIHIDTIPAKEGATDFDALSGMLDSAKDVAAVIVATPNYHGILEDLTGVADKVHAAKALLIVSSPAVTLGAIKSPGEWGADIAAGEAQSLGMPLNFGGPYLGYMCCTKALMRKLPGRIVGATTDADGQRVFVLTLQAREQHIRRDKATSNICSNQGLMALYAAVYLSTMGAAGLREVNSLSAAGAHYMAEALTATGVFELKYPERPFLNEFLLRYKGKVALSTFVESFAMSGIFAGVQTADDELLVCVTEKRSRRAIDDYVERVKLFARQQGNV